MSEHTPGPWKVMPCPVHAGKHMVHDHRWITTANAEFEMSPYVPNDWWVNDGSLICEMRDTASQQHDARLIATAPDLLAGLKWAIAEMQGDSGTGDSYWTTSPHYRAALAAVHKAEGR